MRERYSVFRHRSGPAREKSPFVRSDRQLHFACKNRKKPDKIRVFSAAIYSHFRRKRWDSNPRTVSRHLISSYFDNSESLGITWRIWESSAPANQPGLQAFWRYYTSNLQQIQVIRTHAKNADFLAIWRELGENWAV